jgi:hypothetical protein
MEFIQKYSNKSWDWSDMSLNPSLTIEIIDNFPNKPWNWELISQNKFNGETNLQYYIKRKDNTIKNIEIFKEELLSVSWNPNRFIHWCIDIDQQKEINERWFF